MHAVGVCVCGRLLKHIRQEQGPFEPLSSLLRFIFVANSQGGGQVDGLTVIAMKASKTVSESAQAGTR